MRQSPLVVTAVVLASTLRAASASAQTSNFALAENQTEARGAGWTLTPSFTYQGAWDDNVLLRGAGDQAPADFVNGISPRLGATFVGRHGEFDASYEGTFSLYRTLDGLNGYDHHAEISARRLLTPRTAIWVRDSAVSVPTTELLNFVAVPFVRIGSRLNDLGSGVDIALNKYTTFSAGYMFKMAAFDNSGVTERLFLRGGHSHGANVALKRSLSEQLSVVAGYSLQHALLTDGGTFDVQNGEVGMEYRLSDETRVSGGVGISHLVLSRPEGTRVGPTFRGGLSHNFNRTVVDVSFSRSYVPAFVGFNGTTRNDEIGGYVTTALTRRMYMRSWVAWRSNDPVEGLGLSLKSTWFEADVGYALQPWAHLEAYYSRSHQTILEPAGVYDRNRVGFQIVTAKPVRIH
jgi:hypothetical protein